jgi:hypothetical protein
MIAAGLSGVDAAKVPGYIVRSPVSGGRTANQLVFVD